MSDALARGDWLTVGTIRCLVIEVINILPPQLACEVLTKSLPPRVRTAICNHEGWRFVDLGNPADGSGSLQALIERLDEPGS